MKFTIILVLLGIASSVRCQGKDVVALAIDTFLDNVGYKFRDSCIQESGVDVESVIRLEKEARLSYEPEFKCYVQCHGIKSGVVDEKGVVNVEAVKTVLNATNQKFLDMVEAECKLPRYTHLCDAAFEACVFFITTTII